MLPPLRLAALAALCLAAPLAANAGEAELVVLMGELEMKANELKESAELWQGKRCLESVVGQAACEDRNYHDCE